MSLAKYAPGTDYPIGRGVNSCLNNLSLCPDCVASAPSSLWSQETNCLMSRHRALADDGQISGLSRPGRTNGAQMAHDDHFIEKSLLHSCGGGARESGEECQVFKGREVLRIIDLQTAKKSAMIMKLSVANSSHCCGWGGDKSKHRTTALQHFHYIGDWCIDVVASQEYKTVYTDVWTLKIL